MITYLIILSIVITTLLTFNGPWIGTYNETTMAGIWLCTIVIGGIYLLIKKPFIFALLLAAYFAFKAWG